MAGSDCASVRRRALGAGNFLGQYIEGEWRPGRSGRVFEDQDPFSGDVVAELALASVTDLDDAYQAAARAQPAWERTLPSERARILRNVVSVLEARKDEIVSWLIQETGSTRIKAELEWRSVQAQAIEAASLPHRMDGRILPIDVPGKESRVYRRPVGVVGVISPWNWPMTLSHRSLSAAVALGNAVVLKPADDTPVSGGLLLAQIYEEAGLPPGLLNVVVGAVEEIGDAFTLHPVPRVISFTGSTLVGRRIARLAVEGRIKKVALELGGNAPLVVLDDADLDQAVKAAVFGRFFHQGQICMSTNRVIVDGKVYDEFVARFVERVRGLKVGDPSESDTIIGPLINKRQFDRLVATIDQARRDGVRCVVDGEAEGLVLPPHVFRDVPNESHLAQTELFGPVAPLIRAENEADAMRLANATEYGLSSAVFGRDEERALRFAAGLEVGMTHLNDTTVNAAVNNPFGGEKNSGLGRFGGEWNIHEFTRDHWVTVQHQIRSYPF